MKHVITTHVEISLPGDREEPADREMLEAEASQAVGEFEARMRRGFGAEIGRVEVTVKAGEGEDEPTLDRRTGIEPTRRCLDSRCREPLGHSHKSGCRFNGQVLVLQTGIAE